MTIMKSMTDQEIDRAVTEELRWDPRVDDAGIAVTVRRGVVRLVGTVDTYAKKVAACAAAHRVPGVLDIADEVRVDDRGAKDVDIARRVREALLWDVFVPEQRIRSTVASGWITLEGDVDRYHQLDDAVRAIERLSGVVGVTNRIKVKTPRVEPTGIRTSIEDALVRRAARGVERVRVAVDGDTVKLSGTVDSWAEKDEVERVASCTQGVARVENKILVDPYS